MSRDDRCSVQEKLVKCLRNDTVNVQRRCSCGCFMLLPQGWLSRLSSPPCRARALPHGTASTAQRCGGCGGLDAGFGLVRHVAQDLGRDVARLLRLVRVLGALVDLQMREQAAPQALLGDHPPAQRAAQGAE